MSSSEKVSAEKTEGETLADLPASRSENALAKKSLLRYLVVVSLIAVSKQRPGQRKLCT